MYLATLFSLLEVLKKYTAFIVTSRRPGASQLGDWRLEHVIKLINLKR